MAVMERDISGKSPEVLHKKPLCTLSRIVCGNLGRK
jgi:hypothetical protein